MLRSNLLRNSASIVSSRYSLSSLRKSLHVSKSVVSLTLEEAGQLLPQLQSGPQQSALHRRNRKAKRFGRFLCGELIDIAQDEHASIERFQALDRGIQNGAEFLSRKLLLGILAP